MKKKGQVKYSDIVTIRLEPELREALEGRANDEDRSLASLIRVILRETMEARAPKKGKKKPA